MFWKAIKRGNGEKFCCLKNVMNGKKYNSVQIIAPDWEQILEKIPNFKFKLILLNL